MDRVPDGVQPMLEALEEYIISAGLADMIAAADTITQVRNFFFLKKTLFLTTKMLYLQDSEQYVEKLLNLFKRFSLLVKEAFNEDPRFLTARDKAYKQVVNDTQVFRLELPSKFVSRLKIWFLFYLIMVETNRKVLEIRLNLNRNVLNCLPIFVICYSAKHPSVNDSQQTKSKAN